MSSAAVWLALTVIIYSDGGEQVMVPEGVRSYEECKGWKERQDSVELEEIDLVTGRPIMMILHDCLPIDPAQLAQEIAAVTE